MAACKMYAVLAIYSVLSLALFPTAANLKLKEPLENLDNALNTVVQTMIPGTSTNGSSQHPKVVTLTASNAPLTLQTYNPGTAGIFAVASTLIIGPTEVALIDTQFQKNDTQELVKLLKSFGKKLTLVYNSHYDPDFYFGNEVIQNAFPGTPIYASAATVQNIESTKDQKLAFWKPTLKENAPSTIVVPKQLPDTFFTVDGHRIEIKAPVLPTKSYCWIPSLAVVLGGIPVFGKNMHLWIADDQTVNSRSDWRKTLAAVVQLRPSMVVPSHFYPGIPFTIENVQFTEQYLVKVEELLPKTKNSQELIAAVESVFPGLQATSNLETSAKVLKGEMKWPQ